MYIKCVVLKIKRMNAISNYYNKIFKQYFIMCTLLRFISAWKYYQTTIQIA